jgi:HAD superfamily hydrolase (TIGR01509 family)
MPLVRPDALLLDAGGTLVMFDHQACAALLGRFGVTVSAEALELAHRPAHDAYAAELAAGGEHERGWERLMGRWMALAGVPAARCDEMVAAIRREHAEGRNLWRRVPEGLPEALAALRRDGMRLGVVSNSEGGLAQLFAELGLDELFDVLLDSHHEGVQKPDPEIFLRASRRLGIAPERCLYAGDIPEVDVVGALAAGMGAVLIDAFDAHREYAGAPRFRSVVELSRALPPA